MEEVAEHRFAKDDDGCMSLAAHPIKKAFFAGVNASADVVKMGDNRNARFFYIQNKRYWMGAVFLLSLSPLTLAFILFNIHLEQYTL